MSEEEQEEIIPEIGANMPSSAATTDEDMVVVEEEGEGESGEPPLTPSSAVSLEKEEDLNNLFENEMSKRSKQKEEPKTPEVCELCQFVFSRGSRDHLSLEEDEEYVFTIPKRYEPVKLLGEGAYGYVISAYDSIRKEKVAVKIIRGVFRRSKAFQKRILREIILLKHLRQHDNVIELIDLFPPKDFKSFNDVYIVTDLMDTDLSKLLRRSGRISEKHIKWFIYEILKGLNFLHSAGVLHRDIKPSNILVNRRMEVKLCDFGLSRGIDFDIKMSTHYVVTRWYRSPELLMMWDKTSTSIDLWSVGCIFAEMLSGEKDPRKRVLFKGNGWVDQLKKIVEVRGMPEDHEMHGTSSSMRYMHSLGSMYKKRSLKKLYPKASDLALDLLDQLLVFDAQKRISAMEALKHPYFTKLYTDDSENEDESLMKKSTNFDFRFAQNTDVREIKKILYKEVCDWNEKHHKYKKITMSKKVIHVKEKRSKKKKKN